MNNKKNKKNGNCPPASARPWQAGKLSAPGAVPAGRQGFAFGGKIKNFHQGFSLIEVLLAISLFALIITGLVGALIYGEESTALSGERTRAVFLAEEGLEVVRNIKDENFQNLTNGPHGIAIAANQWSFSGVEDIVQDAVDRFTRQIQISAIDSDTKEVTANVSWKQNELRTDTISLVMRLTNWKTTPKGGILVYGNSTAPTDRIMYKVLNGATGIWSAEVQTADIDASTNRTLRAAKVYSSPTRNEKILVSRHYNGTTQYIYAQVFNGSTWGNVILLSSWNATTYLDVQNFDGTYLNNGYFMVAYSDNTTIPKFRVWIGSVWSASSVSMQNLGTGGIPNYVVLKNRPGTNEAMAAFFDQASDTNTQYFNGGAFIQSSWTLHTEHSAVAPLATKRFVDFDWSPNNSTRGALVYSNSGTDTTLNIKIWTANGSGGGSWSATANTSPAQANRLGAVSVAGRKGADEFIACDKDALAASRIICYESNFTPVWINPANQTLVSGTHTGIQRSYHIGFESISGTTALGIFSNNTANLRMRKYDAVNNSWDATASSIASLGATVATVRLIPQEETDDIMILAANDNLDLYSVVWNGSADAVYTTPAGKALTTHGLYGSVNTDFWYDFAWNKFE